jgi:hypothetical protein
MENKNKETIGGNDIRTSNNVDDTTPVVKVSFNQNGILTFEINEGMNEILVSYLYEFVEKIIPKVTKKSFDEENRKYEGDKNNGKITDYMETRSGGDEEFKNWEIEIKDNKVKEVRDSKDFALMRDDENDISIGFNNENYTMNVENDANTNRDGIIKQILNNDTSTISLSEESKK